MYRFGLHAYACIHLTIRIPKWVKWSHWQWMEVFVSMVTLHPLVFQPPYSSVRVECTIHRSYTEWGIYLCTVDSCSIHTRPVQQYMHAWNTHVTPMYTVSICSQGDGVVKEAGGLEHAYIRIAENGEDDQRDDLEYTHSRHGQLKLPAVSFH